jgi:UDP-glucose 4-epimerase
MNILVTGAAGFIGSHLCRKLVADGNNVLGVDNFKLGKLDNLTELLPDPKFKLIECNILDKDFKEKIKNENLAFDEIWHFAASSDIESGSDNYILDLEDTFITTTKICELAEELKINKLYFSSSGAVYGNHVEHVKETFNCEPISFYGTFKLASEHFLRSNSERFLKKVVIYRFANIIGSNSTHGVIFDFVHKLNKNKKILEVLGNGNQQKPYLHISELINAMFFINSATKEGFHTYNIGPNDEGVKVQTIAEMVVDKMKTNSEIKYGKDNKGWVGDIPKIRFNNHKLKLLGWSPKLSSQQAVEIAVSEIISEIGSPLID